MQYKNNLRIIAINTAVFLAITGFFSFTLCAEDTDDIRIAQSGQAVSSDEKEPDYFFYPLIKQMDFVRRSPIHPHGSIFKVKENKTMISDGDIVYIRQIGNTSLILGRYYTIYRTLKLPENENVKNKDGIQYHMTGTVEITKKETRFAVAKVLETFDPIEIGDLVMPYAERSSKIVLTESTKGIDGEIIASEGHTDIIGDNSVVFINKGKNDGIRPGQYYNIYYQEKAKIDPKRHESMLLNPVDFGTLLVLQTENTMSTALIIRADKIITPGAKFHTPSF